MALPKLNKSTGIAAVEVIVALVLLMHAYKTIK
jgi:hypothetical protein